MLGFFRAMMKSKWGVLVTLLFLGMIALAFAGSDVANNGTFGGVGGGDRVAIVGGDRVSTSDLMTAAQDAFERERQQNPTMTMQAFASAATLNEVLEGVISRVGLASFARQLGLRAGTRLVNSEIQQVPQFRDASGNFDRDAFLAILGQQGLNEAQVREQFAQGLLARQLLSPIDLGATMPASVARRYVSLLLESRTGTVAILPSAAYLPTAAPTAAQLQDYYKAHGAKYIRPERRVLRYAVFGDDALGALPPPTEAQIKAYYDGNTALYAASERRSFTQLVVPTQQAAQAIEAEVKRGKSLDAAAREKGLSTAKVGPVSQAQFAEQASAAVAQGAFAAGQGALTTPARGGLGWYVLRVDSIERTAGRSLAAARGEIVAALSAQQRRTALNELTGAMEDELDKGAALADVAKEHGLTLQTSPPITADGKVYGQPGELLPAMKPILSTAFAMDEEEGQLAQIEAGKTFVAFEVAEITASATAPLAEIRADVEADWRKAQGSAAAKQAAERVLQRMQGGATLAAAMAAEKRAFPAADHVEMKRAQLTQLARQGRVPAPLALLFSMAQGTEKRLEAPNNNGWFIVQLDKITLGDVKADSPDVAQGRLELGATTGGEYREQFVRAVLDELGVERNRTAINSVLNRLSGRDAQ